MFANKIGTSLNYLRSAICKKKEFGIRLCIRIEDATDGAVMIDDLIPGVDWDKYVERRLERKRRAMQSDREAA